MRPRFYAIGDPFPDTKPDVLVTILAELRYQFPYALLAAYSGERGNDMKLAQIREAVVSIANEEDIGLDLFHEIKKSPWVLFKTTDRQLASDLLDYGIVVNRKERHLITFRPLVPPAPTCRTFTVKVIPIVAGTAYTKTLIKTSLRKVLKADDLVVATMRQSDLFYVKVWLPTNDRTMN